MNKTICLQKAIALLVLIQCCTAIAAQELSTKFGKVTNDELLMSSYSNDSTASAVVLYKKGRTLYEYIGNMFRICYNIENKTKILKSDGTSYANVTIPYYDSSKNTMKEVVIDIDAFSYNLENGKEVKTKMKKEYIFKERVSDKYMQVKFSIPNVKVGSVIEYKYKVLSDFYYQLPTWVMQGELPVVYNEYDITIPQYFKFNMEMRGSDRIETTDESVPVTYTVQGGAAYQAEPVHATARNIIFVGKNLPAIKDDSQVWCADDYKAQIIFELLGLDFPGSVYQPFTTTWEKIDELLLEDEEFGGLLKLKNPFREEMRSMNLTQMSTKDKIAAIFCLLKKKIAWNENYALYGKDISKVIKTGSGSNADINFILMSMLREAGVACDPLVMSARDRGVLPYTHPSIQKLNTFVVAAQETDSTKVFLDGSITCGYLNVLPPILLVDRARLVSATNNQTKWFALNRVCESQVRALISATIMPDGSIVGERNTVYSGQFAGRHRKRMNAAKDSTAFITDLETEDDFKILQYQQDSKEDFNSQIKEKISFTKQASATDEYIYINPMVFKHISTNPYMQENRKLPVEMPYPYSLRISNSLTIPEGYQVEELPKQVQFSMDNEGGTCRYLVQVVDNRILMTYIFSMNRIFFAAEEYNFLKEFWGTIVNKNNEMIVLKKKTL